MNDLDQLKELLFGAEKEALDSISRRVERREVRAADVADILPEAIHQSHSKDDDLVEALTSPVGECVQRAMHEDPETYGNALYPVIGPAIRKSVMHALRNFSQQINEAVEHSISPTGLKWRWEASRAGVPFGEYVLQRTMQYRVEQAYLISRDSGLLVGHVHHEASKIKDSDAVSAMFTAIQDFVKESFSPDRTGRLESADMGEFTLWAVHGPHALLVCVIRGVPPKGLRADLSAILERIHFRYGEAIREYKGDTSTVPDVDVELERCLRFEARREKRGDRKKGGVLIITLLLMFAVAVFFGYRSWSHAQQLDRLNAALTKSPGIHVTEIDRDGDAFFVRGLRDPLALPVGDIAESVDIPAAQITAVMQPFQSLQPEIVEARATQVLGRPQSVSFEVTAATLHVSGDAPWSWRQQLRSRFGLLAGVSELDMSGLTTSDRLSFEARAEQLTGARFHFEKGTIFSPGNEERLVKHAENLGTLLADAAAVGYSVSVMLHGSTDLTGQPAQNVVLAQQRVEVAAAVLRSQGVDVADMMQAPAGDPQVQPQSDDNKRYAQVDLLLNSLTDP